MENKVWKESTKNRIIASSVTVALLIVVGLFVDYYFALNDDMLMKNIISGAYLGKPDAHNVQMLYPLSFLLSLIYRILPFSISWYGIFFLVCQFGCIYLLLNRCLTFCHKVWMKYAVVLSVIGFVVALSLTEIVSIQYTVTAALLAGTAIFLFMTGDKCETIRDFFRLNTICIILVLVAFCMRTEMLLLLFPLICFAGLIKWSEEGNVFTKVNFTKYLTFFITILLGMGIFFGADQMAYSAPEWKEFREFFDARTQVYDFYGIPPYEENKGLYEEIGISSSEFILLTNYNFALDEEINAKLMSNIAEYQKSQRDISFQKQRLGDSIWSYTHKMLPIGDKDKFIDDYPFNSIVIFLYAMIVILAIINKKASYFWKVPLLGFIRSALWIFLIFRDRVPARISHSLYFAEILVLIALIAIEYNRVKQKKIVGIIAVATTLMVVSYLPTQIKSVLAEAQTRKAVQSKFDAVATYCANNPEEFYYLDVYSVVDFADPLWKTNETTYQNYDFLGGWLAKSPLYHQKSDGRIEKNSFQLIARTDSSIDWLFAYYQEKGYNIEVKEKGTISIDGSAVFTVYGINQQIPE